MRALGLRARLVLLVLVALAPVFGLVAWDTLHKQRGALGNARAALLSQAQLAAAAQDRLVDRTRSLLEAVGNAPAIREATPDRCTDYFAGLLQQYPVYTVLGLVSPEGQVICNDREARLPVPESARASLDEFLKVQRFMMGSYTVGQRSGRAQVMFAAPVQDHQGQLVNIVYTAVGVQAFASLLDGQPRVDGSETLVLDGNGTVLAAMPASAAAVGTRVTEPVVAELLASPTGGLRRATGADGRAREWAFARPADGTGTRILVAVSVPRDLIIAPVASDFLRQLAVLLLTALLGGLAAWWMGERIMLAPARMLLTKARALAGGDLDARVPQDSRHPREIARLAQSFNHMAAALQERQQALDHTLRELETDHALVDLIIDNMSEGVVAANTDGRLLLFNTAARRLFGPAEPGQMLDAATLGHELRSFSGGPLAASARPLARAIRGESLDRWEATALYPEGIERVLSLNARPVRDAAGQLIGGLVVVTDVTDRRVAEDFERGQEHVLELIAAGVPEAEALDAVVQLFEQRIPGAYATVLVPAEGRLRHVAGHSLPEDVVRALDGLEIRDGDSACGTAAARREMVVVEDMSQDPLTHHWREVVDRMGVVACWALPVLGSGNEVLAVFALYHRTRGGPDSVLSMLMDVAARLVRLAVERGRAVQALRESEARFRELAENIQDVFYTLDPRAGRMLYVSPAYETLWGRSSAGLLENAALLGNSVHPDDRERVQRLRAESGAHLSEVQYRVLRPDGSVRWVQEHSYPVSGTVGEPERIVGTMRDITQRKQADLDLMQTNRALQMLSRGNEALVRAEDEQELLLEICRLAVNVGGYQMAWVGYANEDEERTITPQAWAGQESGYLGEVMVTWSEDDPRGQGPAGRTVRSGHVVVCEDLMAESSGFFWRAQAFERGYRSLICLPLHDGRRNFGMIALFSPTILKTRWEEIKLLQELAANLAYGIASLRARDQQRRIEAAMREANERLGEQASLLDRAQDAIIVRSVENQLVRYWNKGAERLYGWSAAEAIGRPMFERLYAEPGPYEAAMATLLERGEWTGELEQRARDGRTITVEGRWTLVRDTEGKPYSVLAINTDVGERKRARDQILRLNADLEERVQRRTAQLLAANKELEAFSYSVSHDLRTPLNAIDGFSHLLQRSLANSADERQKHFLTRIRSGTKQMGELIEGLLLLSQITRAAMREEPVDLGALAQQAIASWRERDPQREVAVVIHDDLQALGDPRLLRQVIENLVGNAWKFTVHQAAPRIEVGSGGTDDGNRVFFVRDNGAGFDMAHAGKLFGAFQRLHSVTDFPGTGIGLATVQRIVKRHGGRIWAESAPGEGATFFFTLARAEVI